MTFEELWHQVKNPAADKLEFCRGGGKQSLWLGRFVFSMGLLLFGVILFYSQMFAEWISDALRHKEYELAITAFLFIGAMTLGASGKLASGVWLIFGRTHVLLDRTSKSMTKEFRVRSFCLFSKSYLIGTSSSFSLRRTIRSFAPLHFLLLNDAQNRHRWILIFPRNFINDSWAMAEQMAGFFSIPLLEKGKA